MLIVAIQTRTKDWQALTEAFRKACHARPRYGVTRYALCRNAHNAALAWLLIECPDSTAYADVQPWFEALIADLDGHHPEHTVWEAIESFDG